jgi:hypothetical protein
MKLGLRFSNPSLKGDFGDDFWGFLGLWVFRFLKSSPGKGKSHGGGITPLSRGEYPLNPFL